MIFDAVVIGKGLMGTAVTRYLSQAGLATAVIGPDEPPDFLSHPGVFASHYDQGRITRQLSKDKVWSTLAIQAIAQYPHLQEQSGIQFYEPIGGLYISQPAEDNKYLEDIARTARQFNVPYDVLTSLQLANKFPFLTFPPHFQAIYESAPAGYINPRELIRAQLTIAQQNGATIIRETALRLKAIDHQFQIETDRGHSIQAKNLMLAAGAFTNCHKLLSEPLDLKVKTETIILAELTDRGADILQGMPTIIYRIESPVISDIYLLPPILYPNGRVYIKMGCNTTADRYLSNLEEMRQWIIAGDSDVAFEAMKQALLDILPDLKVTSFQTKRCLVTYTPHGYPFIDQIGDGFYVATGGNGSSAKSSDAIGKLAADLIIHDGWISALDRSSFKAVFA